jgi:hypothetical protein
MAAFCIMNGVISIITSIVFIFKSFSVPHKGFLNILNIIVIVFALIVYSYLTVVSIFAYRTYTQGCPCPQNSGETENYSSPVESTNYGSITIKDNSNKGYTPFSGQGVKLNSS